MTSSPKLKYSHSKVHLLPLFIIYEKTSIQIDSNPSSISNMSSNKRIFFSSSVDTDASHFHERVEDKSTGKVKTFDGPKAVNGTKKVTITTNPYTEETDGTEKTKTKEGSAKTFNVKPEYDTSQL